MPNPASQIKEPITANDPKSFRVVVVIAASAAANVKVTHRPCKVQVLRKRMNEGLISSNRASLPRPLNPPVQKYAQTSRPYNHHRQKKDRPAVYLGAKNHRQCRHRDIGNAARDIKKLLGLPQIGWNEGQPLYQEDNSNSQGKEWGPKDSSAPLTAGQCNSHSDQNKLSES